MIVRSLATVGLCASAVVFGAACSSIPSADAMRAYNQPIVGTWPVAASVRVTGGQNFAFRIGNAEFEKALRDSIVDAGVFSAVVAVGTGEYQLDVVLGDGHGMEARELTVLWSVSRVPTHEVVWQEFVTSRGRSHHFLGVTRQRRSLEMAAQENIRLGIEALSRAELDAPL